MKIKMASSKQKGDDDSEQELQPEGPSGVAANGLEDTENPPAGAAFPVTDPQPPVHLVDLHGYTSTSASSSDGEHGFSPTSSTPQVPLHHQNGAHSGMSMGSFDPVPHCFLPSGAPYLGANNSGAPYLGANNSGAPYLGANNSGALYLGAGDSVQPSCSSGGSDDTQNGGVSSTSCEPSTSGGKRKGGVVKDGAYWEKRRKNNESAKRSRENRRNKEHLISARHTVLSSQFCTLEGLLNAVLQQVIELERTLLGRTIETAHLLDNIFEWNDGLLHELQELLKETLLNSRRKGDPDSQYVLYPPHQNHFQGPPPPPPPPSAGGIVG